MAYQSPAKETPWIDFAEWKYMEMWYAYHEEMLFPGLRKTLSFILPKSNKMTITINKSKDKQYFVLLHNSANSQVEYTSETYTRKASAVKRARLTALSLKVTPKIIDVTKGISPVHYISTTPKSK